MKNLFFVYVLLICLSGCTDSPKERVEHLQPIEQQYISGEMDNMQVSSFTSDEVHSDEDRESISDVDDVLESVYQQVVDESIQEYQIAKKHGDLVDVCVQAGLVSAAQLQAKNEDGYAKWKNIEKADCEAYENQVELSFDELDSTDIDNLSK
ncbi:hypothetical protein SAMN05421749_104282 [Acinetobacter marinus]|uniref:Uncharacterized protein n=1 Tax=Acinetobacter marinus TaxID=281375 RepID=A0A1G6L2Y0_9GAMM|nr:hypothetical protein [Acinetobacter marinus]SDC37544.1 hypothetical protein SAMN05421749_104282 [Acinetobacter marinus]